MAISDLMDRSSVNVAKAQIGFIDYIVKPIEEDRVRRASPVRLSAEPRHAPAAGLACDPEDTGAALPRGEAAGEEAWRAHASPRDMSVDAGARAGQ